MKHLLLDVNIVIDLCVERPGTALSELAVATARHHGLTTWIYVGSVQTLEYATASVLKAAADKSGAAISRSLALARARALLAGLTVGHQWLAALAGEGAVFQADEPEDEQLVRALDRFNPGEISLLTRDAGLLDRADPRVLSPDQYLQNHASAQTGEDIPPPRRPIEFIDLKAQQDALRPTLERNIHRVLHHGQYILGPEVAELERRLTGYTGAAHCITVASGTEALLISLMALGIGPGDEVITTPFTFVATAEVIVLLGAKPVFVDIEPDTCNIDASKIEAAITPRTRAIMPVSLYGQVADMDEINAVAARNGGIPVIEDAAQSFGATYKGHKSCNLSTFGCTSFFPSKPLGCYGDGGAIFTNDDALAQACREIRVHGQSRRYVHTRIGVGGRMDTLQCAAVLGKLERFAWEVERRQLLGERYRELLAAAGLPVRPVVVRGDRDCAWAQYTVFVEDRAALQERLLAQGIPTAVHYPVPLHRQPAYASVSFHYGCPHSEAAGTRVMSLPMSADLTAEQQVYVCSALARALA